MSRQHTALHLRQIANEVERSAISHQKTLQIVSKLIILFQNSSFSKMKQVELDSSENSRGRDLTRIMDTN